MKVVLPKGRLFERSFELMKEVGLQLKRPDDRDLIAGTGKDELMVPKPFDVPVYVERIADMGITGRDVVEERNCDVFIPLRLPFGECRLSIAVPQEEDIEVEEMDGYRIATEFPNISERYFKEKNVEVEIVRVDGSTELAPRAEISDAIVDIVQTGSTLEANGLVELEKIIDVSAVLLVNRISQKTRFEEINELISKLKEVSQDGR
ncbi:MAG: ATP phosphoribosyltransferase [Thermoplasmata archaeon]